MRDVVRDAWVSFTEVFEGGIPSLYQDILGKVTIAYGNLCDSASAVAALPMVYTSGAPASYADKVAAFNAVKSSPDAARLGWRYASKLSTLRLPTEEMVRLALARLTINNAALVAQLPDFEEMNACAQMAMHSWAWACGPNAHFPKLFAALKAHDYACYISHVVDGEDVDALSGGAAFEIYINEWTKTPAGKSIQNTGLIPRNLANKVLMRNAARIEAFKLDPDLLDWKNVLGVSDTPTQPEIENPESE